MKSKSILIIEDEPTLLRLLSSYFEKAGYETYRAKDGEIGINIFLNTQIDLVILDIMLPKINGFEVLKRIRTSSDIPVIMMTALGEEESMIKGYSLKADDYIVKPFPPKVLVMKVNNLLNRLDDPSTVKKEYVIGKLKLNFLTNTASIADKELTLSKTEFKLLSFLAENQNKACSRNLLLDEIWGMDVYVDNRIVDTYIKKIRKQLKPYSYIKTVFGVGYKLEVNDENEE